MIQSNTYSRFLGAGGIAIGVTAILGFIMQLLVMQGEVVLKEEVPPFEPDLWMKDKPLDIRPNQPVLPVRQQVVDTPPMALPPLDVVDPRAGSGYQPARPNANKDVLKPGQIVDRGSYPRFRTQQQWPRRALEKGISGWVAIGFTISATGSVKKPYVLGSSNSMFERYGLKAVSGYTYVPTIKQGRPVETPGQTIRLVWQISD